MKEDCPSEVQVLFYFVLPSPHFFMVKTKHSVTVTKKKKHDSNNFNCANCTVLPQLHALVEVCLRFFNHAENIWIFGSQSTIELHHICQRLRACAEDPSFFLKMKYIVFLVLNLLLVYACQKMPNVYFRNFQSLFIQVLYTWRSV